MTNHPNRSLPALPVLDDDAFDGMVLGFARTETGALKIARRHAAKTETEGVIGVQQIGSLRVTADPDINTKAQAARANAAGRGWVMIVTPLTLNVA
jgi:hypothetical protein